MLPQRCHGRVEKRPAIEQQARRRTNPAMPHDAGVCEKHFGGGKAAGDSAFVSSHGEPLSVACGVDDGKSIYLGIHEVGQLSESLDGVKGGVAVEGRSQEEDLSILLQ
jgi:hypothetical protein